MTLIQKISPNIIGADLKMSAFYRRVIKVLIQTPGIATRTVITLTHCEFCQRELSSEESSKMHIKATVHTRELRKQRKLSQAELCHQKRNMHLIITAQSGPLARFFDSYSNFEYDSLKSSAEEYTRLRRLYGWKRGDLEKETAWSAFRLALIKEFNRLFGTDSYDLLAWQNLCVIVEIQSRLKTREECVRVRLVVS